MTAGECRKIRALYLEGKARLTSCGIEDSSFDALALLGKVCGVGNRQQLAIDGDKTLSAELCAEYRALIERRLSQPLQYILGRWEFDGIPLQVGNGVLIPREDTLTVVQAAQQALAGIDSPRILDLCAGTGAIGIALARRIPSANVLCVEKSPEALAYLRRNTSEFGEGRVAVAEGDVLSEPKIQALMPDKFAGKFHCIVSNPPYIPSRDISSLQWEVRAEPTMALDGGDDGLRFYRAICAHWLDMLEPRGIVAFESGYDISNGVKSVMTHHRLSDISAFCDINGIERCIIGTLT